MNTVGNVDSPDILTIDVSEEARKNKNLIEFGVTTVKIGSNYPMRLLIMAFPRQGALLLDITT